MIGTWIYVSNEKLRDRHVSPIDGRTLDTGRSYVVVVSRYVGNERVETTLADFPYRHPFSWKEAQDKAVERCAFYAEAFGVTNGCPVTLRKVSP